MNITKILGIDLYLLSSEERFNFLILFINICTLMCTNTNKMAEQRIMLRYLSVLTKHIKQEETAKLYLSSPFPEDIYTGKMLKIKCDKLYYTRIPLYLNMLDDIEQIPFMLTEHDFVNYHKRIMINNEQIALAILKRINDRI